VLYNQLKNTNFAAVGGVAASEGNSLAIRNELIKSMPDTEATAATIQAQISQLTSPWFRYFLHYNPIPTLKKVKCPVLILNGERDVQVSAKINIEAINRALTEGGNKQVTTKIFPRLNHLFQECETGLPTEYQTIEQTIAPEVLDVMAGWIKKQ
jgi:dipeptidyl aminopeptidase/acylaminoacyl peptidase